MLSGDRPIDIGGVTEITAEFLPGALLAGRLAPKGDTLGIFAGSRAATADKAKLKTAKNMAEKGASREDTWRKTGWFKDVDGNWKFEISDVGAKTIAPRPKESEGTLQHVSDVFEHPEAFKAYSGAKAHLPGKLKGEKYNLMRRREYLLDVKNNANKQGYQPFTPDMRKELASLPEKLREIDWALDAVRGERQALDKVYVAPHNDPASGGKYYPKRDAVSIAALRGSAPDRYRLVMLHELQHAIQERENFARGGSPAQFKDIKITSPEWSRWNDYKHVVDEMKSIYNGRGYKAERNKVNKIFAKEYEPRIKSLEQKFDIYQKEASKASRDELVALLRDRMGAERHLDAVWKGWDKRIESIQPLYKRLVELNAKYNVNIKEPPKHIDANEAYTRLAGEVEARNVEFRANFTDAERLAKPPWTTMDKRAGDIIGKDPPLTLRSSWRSGETLKAASSPPPLGQLNDNRQGGLGLLEPKLEGRDQFESFVSPRNRKILSNQPRLFDLPYRGGII
jgi:hypothetical protein